MSGGSIVEHIDAVDAYARTLFVRAKQSSEHAVADDLSLGVQRLHLSLRHLRIEIADPDSLINSTDAHARRLKAVVEGSESALRLLEHVLDRHGAVGEHVIEGISDGVAAATSKLAHEKLVIDDLLDRVQLDKIPRVGVVDGSEPGLEAIKQKLDVVAQRLLARRGNMADEDSSVWQDFKVELEKEGFSSKILQQHKDVLRAYIRELQNVSAANGGSTPTVQGLLEVARKPASRKGRYAANDDRKEDRRPDEKAIAPLQKQFSYDRDPMTSEEITKELDNCPEMVSTRDLVSWDDPLNAGPRRQSASRRRGVSFSSPRSSAPDTLEPEAESELSRSFNSRLSFSQLQPPLPRGGSATYGSSVPSTSLPSLHVAPDRHGRDIPLDAQWTRIKRTLVSPEVLQRAGVRYEARPEYVAVLGRLNRDQIAYYARLSAECRASRMGKSSESHERHDYSRKTRRYDDESDDSSSDTSDESDGYDENEEKGTNSYPVIVNPPEKLASPTTTVMPKPILKNKNQNQIRFDPDPYEVEKGMEKEDGDRRERRRRERDRHRDDHSRRRDDGHRRDEHRCHRDDRHRDRDDGHHRDHSHRDHSHRDRDDDHHRHRGSDRDRRSHRKDRRRAWGETLGAVGISGAAASLLGILAEAALKGEA